MATDLLSYIPTAFPTLALAHFLALLSPGPDFFFGHRTCGTSPSARRGVHLRGHRPWQRHIHRAGRGGWATIRHSPLLYRGMELASAAYLIWMGWMLLKSSYRSVAADVPTMQEQPALSPIRQLLAGLGSALLNPKNAVFYLTLMTIILGPETTPGQQLFAGIWMTSLVFLWDAGLARIISLPGMRRRLWTCIPLIEGVAGCVLILLAGVLVIVPFFAV